MRRWAELSIVLLTVAGCGGSSGPDAGFGQDSPRPECQYTPAAGREPWAMPQLVAAGFDQPVELDAPLNTACPEDAIEISRDGRTLYFYWSPTVGASSRELLTGTTGTYRAERVGSDPGAFADPRFFDLRRGAAGGACDGELSFSPSGDRVYFHSTRAANTGYRAQPPVDDPMDIYVAPIEDGVPGPAENLGPPVNSDYLDGEHCLSPDGSRLYFTSTRPDGQGQADIWVSTRDGDSWGEPQNLGPPIDSAGADLQPAFAADDPDTMYFVSDRDGPTSIYRSVRQGDGWGEPEMILTGYVGEPSLVEDGSILYFVHVSVDDQGVFGSDVWYVRRQD